jgi:hypothetical protein
MLLTSKNTRVAFSVTNCICYDQRVLKIADVVKSLDCEIEIIGGNQVTAVIMTLCPSKQKDSGCS